MHNNFFNAAFALYFTAFLSFLLGFLLAKPWKNKISLVILSAGWIAQTAHLVLRWQAAGRAPFSNQYESLVFLVWACLGIFLVFAKFSYTLLERLIPWVALAGAVGLGGATLLNSSIEPLVPALQSDWLLFHVTTVMLGYASFLLAFLGAIYYLVLHRDVDLFNYRACALGFWLLTLGVITGSVWANSAWGSYWSWDPKETWSLITWIFYAIALHLRRTKDWKETRFAWLCAAGFIFVLFTYFGVNYLLKGLHSYA